MQDLFSEIIPRTAIGKNATNKRGVVDEKDAHIRRICGMCTCIVIGFKESRKDSLYLSLSRVGRFAYCPPDRCHPHIHDASAPTASTSLISPLSVVCSGARAQGSRRAIHEHAESLMEVGYVRVGVVSLGKA